MAFDYPSLTRRWFEEVWNQRRVETIDELLTDDSVCHTEFGPIQGKQAFKERSYDVFVSTFPDLRVTVNQLISDGDRVVAHWTAAGTHLGDGFGSPPTGRAVSFQGMTWIRFQGDKFIEGWDCWNVDGLVRLLKQQPEPVSPVV